MLVSLKEEMYLQLNNIRVTFKTRDLLAEIYENIRAQL